MRGILFIPYIDYNNNNFVYQDEEFDKNYVDYLHREYIKHKFTVDNVLEACKRNNNMSIINSTTNRKQAENVKINNNYNYYKTPIELLNVYGRPEDFNHLIGYFQTQQMFPIIIKFDDIQKIPEIEAEFKMWIRETNKVKQAEQLNEAEKIMYLPKKDLKVSFGLNSNAILKGCKILDIYSLNSYGISVNNIIFVR